MKITNDAKLKILEYQKSKNDIFYFSENYVNLAQSGVDIIPKLYKPQKEFLKTLLDDHYVVLLKSRQTGGSTAAQIYIAWSMIFHKNIIVGVVSRKGDESTDFAKKIMQIINNVPEWMRPKYTKQTERTFRLDNGSELYAEAVIASNPGSLFRGKSITIAVVDEAAHINYIDKAYTSFAPALFKAHQVAKQQNVPYSLMVISTPNRTVGIGKWFYQMYLDSLTNESLFKNRTLYWRDIPEFANDPQWYITQCKLLNNDPAKIKQELEMQFLGSDDSWLPLSTIDELNKCFTPPISSIPFEGGDIWIWKSIDPSDFYLIGVDTASASGEDKSTIEVFSFETLEQVAEFRGKLEVFNFCKILDLVNKLYPNNLIIIENNSYGNQVVETLKNSEVSYNLYMQKERRGKLPVVYGLSNNSKTRPLMMDALFTYVTENPSMIKSQRLALELVGLVSKQTATTQRVEADKGEHDDLVLALAFICYVRKYDPPLGVETKSSKEALNQITDIVAFNDESLRLMNTLSNLSTNASSNRNLGTINKNILEYVKSNMHNVDSDSDMNQVKIDVLDLLGYTRM